MKKFLQIIVADPLTGEALKFDRTTGQLFNEGNGQHYGLTAEIPILLPAKPGQEAVKKDALHGRFDSTFDYAGHYQRDAEYFDYFKLHDDGASRHENRRLHEAIIRQVLPGASLMLDVGCGNGWVAGYFCPRKVRVVSMDISTVNPLEACKRVPDEYHAGLVGDVYNLPLQKNSVDCIIAAEIMEHVPDPALFIQKLLAAVKPGGSLIITTPYNEQIEYYLCVHCNRPTPKDGHLHSFNEKNILEYLPLAGATWRFTKFSNKFLTKIRSHLLLQFLPHALWRWVDGLANRLFSKPTRFLIKIRKEV